MKWILAKLFGDRKLKSSPTKPFRPHWSYFPATHSIECRWKDGSEFTFEHAGPWLELFRSPTGEVIGVYIKLSTDIPQGHAVHSDALPKSTF